MTYGHVEGALIPSLTFTSLALLEIYVLTVKYRVELGALAVDPIQGRLITEEAKQRSIAGGKTQDKIGLGGNNTNDSNHSEYFSNTSLLPG